MFVATLVARVSAVALFGAATVVLAAQKPPAKPLSEVFDSVTGTLVSGEPFREMRAGRSIDKMIGDLGLTRVPPSPRSSGQVAQWTAKDAAGDIRVTVITDSRENRGIAILTFAAPKPVHPQILSYWLDKGSSQFSGDELLITLPERSIDECGMKDQLSVNWSSGAMLYRVVSVRCS